MKVIGKYLKGQGKTGKDKKIATMILFDYGQTLIKLQKLDVVYGTAAVLQYATINKDYLTVEQV